MQDEWRECDTIQTWKPTANTGTHFCGQHLDVFDTKLVWINSQHFFDTLFNLSSFSFPQFFYPVNPNFVLLSSYQSPSVLELCSIQKQLCWKVQKLSYNILTTYNSVTHSQYIQFHYPHQICFFSTLFISFACFVVLICFLFWWPFCNFVNNDMIMKTTLTV